MMTTTCQYEVLAERREGLYPHPSEICGDETVPGEDFCEPHLVAVYADESIDDEDRYLDFIDESRML
jgi:hypothetical protein